MAQIGDIGGGSTTSICSISPSDEKAILGNLISRVRDIEKFLSQLVGADVHANNLAELAKDLGDVVNGTIMLPLNPNSPYGVGGSIPVPAGYTGSVINGNVITTWTNGVVSVQLTSGGVTTGGGGGSAVTDWLVVEPASTTVTSNTIDLSTVLWSNGSAFGVSGLSNGRININSSGYYRFSVNLGCLVRSTAGSSILRAELQNGSSVTTKIFENLYGQHTSGNQNQTLIISGAFEAPSGYSLLIRGVTSSILGLQNLTSHAVAIEKLG